MVFFSIFIFFIIYTDYSKQDPFITEKIEKKIEITRVVNIEREKLFDSMTDLKNYPTILPNNVLSVNIINQSESVIFAEEKFIEGGIIINVVAKHTIFPYDKHIVTIMNGDAQNTTVTTTFEDLDSSTKLTVELKMNLKGFLIPLGLLPQDQFEHAINTVISGFEDYAKKLS